MTNVKQGGNVVLEDCVDLWLEKTGYVVHKEVQNEAVA